MSEFVINNKSKTTYLLTVVAGAYLTVFCLYFTIIEVLGKHFGFCFFVSLIGLLLAGTLLLQNLLQSKALLKIDNNEIKANIASQGAISIEWAYVSEANIGVSYVTFLLNGKKQQKLDLSSLSYNDMRNAKNKIIELCEFKNIPYKND